jgi:LysM repeat protein
VHSTREELEDIKENVHKTILEDFAPLIIDVSKTSEINEKDTSSDYPIKIYEPLIPASPDELRNLRIAYLRELGLISHPLFDLYFLQIAHAQVFGDLELYSLKRQLLSVGRATYKTINTWRQLLFGKDQGGSEYLIGKNPVTNDDKSLREFLKLLVESYFREDWRDVVSDAVDLGIDLGLIVARTGMLGWQDAAIQIMLFHGKKNLSESLTNTGLSAGKKVFKGSVGLLLIFLACFLLSVGPIFYLSYINKLVSRPTNDEVVLPEIILTVTDDFLPTPILDIETTEPISTETIPSVEEMPTIVTVEAQLVNETLDPNYCMYVVQPSDSVQSVATRFNVSEVNIRSQNGQVALKSFVVNQMVRVNASCCSPIGGRGFSYTVQARDNLYNLSNKYSTTINAIASANNLHAPWYIQTGQMLCIPFP